MLSLVYYWYVLPLSTHNIDFPAQGRFQGSYLPDALTSTPESYEGDLAIWVNAERIHVSQVDRVGRKVLLLCGSIQGFLAEVAAAILLAVTYEGGQVRF